MKRTLLLLFFIILGFFLACKPQADYRTEYQKNGTYPISGGEFKEPVAMIFADRNGVIDVNWGAGSSFLVDAERGLFGTAKHVVAHDVSYKIYFCGRVYEGERVLSSVVTDVDYFRITSDFDPSQFPKPYPLGSDANVGDLVFVRGIHPHPHNLQVGKIVHGVIHFYYGMTNYSQEFVYDNLPARVSDKKVCFSNSTVGGGDKTLDAVIQCYTQVMTLEEHRVGNKGFAGLSGGPTINGKGEIIGLNSNQLGDEEIIVLDREGFRYLPRKTLHLVPVSEIRRSLDHIK